MMKMIQRYSFFSIYTLKVSRMDYAEISVDPKFHRHLIGKGGVNSKYSVTDVLTACNKIRLCIPLLTLHAK